MREIVFDTETTGLDPLQGDRLVEIGCIELVNRFPTGKVFHCYFNPQRDMPEQAFKIHGLSSEFLKDRSLFADKVDELIVFLGDAQLVAQVVGHDVQAGFPPIRVDAHQILAAIRQPDLVEPGARQP